MMSVAHDLLNLIEQSRLAVWTRESPSIWAYPTILTLHTYGLAALVGSNLVIDLRILGNAPAVPLERLSTLYWWMWTGLVINTTTGTLLFAADASAKSTQKVFWLKLGFIASALIVSLLLRRDVVRAATAHAAGSTQRLAIVSIALWVAAIVAGRLMAYT